MAPVFSDFCEEVIKKSRGVAAGNNVKYDPVLLNVNNIDLKFPHQLFINGEFVNSESEDTMECINPSDETLICKVIYCK